MRTATLLFATAITLAACTRSSSKEKEKAPPPPPPTDAAVTTTFDGETVVKNGCLSCHAEDMLAQQRLTPAQWTKTVTKMQGWGANVEPHEVAPLATWLAARYGLDAGGWEPSAAKPNEVAAELERTEDGPFANGSAERGKALFVDKCSGCHGADARGHIGVMLVDRPLLWRAADVASVVRRGRGKMTPTPLSDAQIADVLAHLRSLTNPPP